MKNNGRKRTLLFLLIVAITFGAVAIFSGDEVTQAAVKKYTWKDNQKVSLTGKVSKVSGKHPAGYDTSGYVLKLDQKVDIVVKTYDGPEKYRTQKVQVVISKNDYNKYKGKKVKVTGNVMAPTTAWYVCDIALLNASVKPVSTPTSDKKENTKVSSVTKVTGTHKFSNEMDQLVLKGKDKNNNVVWTYKSPAQYLTELDVNQYFINGNQIYVFSDKLYCISKKNGKELWSMDETVLAGVYTTFDAQGNMYCIGYYDDYVYGISKNGALLFKSPMADGCYWPYQIQLKDGEIWVKVSANEEGEELENTYLVYDMDGDFVERVE